MKSRGQRWQPLPEGLTPGQRDFFHELRRVVEAAGLTYRELERKTSTARTGTAEPAFYSKSQWARWLNGQAMPPRRAVRRLAAVAIVDDPADGPAAERLLPLWERSAGSCDEEPDTGKPLPPRQVPSVTPHFTGRAVEFGVLDELAGQVTGGGGAGVVVITGTAGVGKTTLANYFCQRAAARFPDGQLYVNLRGFDPGGQPLDAPAALRGFLEALGEKYGSVPVDDDAQAALYRTLLADRRMLIVLDNARSAEQVRRLIPGSPGCLVLVTSRNQLVGLLAQGAQILTLAPFSDSDAHGFLARRLGAARVEREPRAAEELTRLCAALPLAMSVAAAYAVAHPGRTLSALAGQLRERGLDQLDTGDKETSARAVFSWSYHDLSEPAKRMFRLLAALLGPDTSIAAAASLAGMPAALAHAALGELGRAHLAHEHAPARFAMHDLLRAYAAELARTVDGADSLRAAGLRLLDHYLHTGHAAALLLLPASDLGDLAPAAPGAVTDPPGTVDEALAWLTAESRPLLAACAWTSEHGPAAHSWQLAAVVDPYLTAQGRWVDLVVTQRAAVAAAERARDPRGVGHARYHLAHALALSGDGEAVEPCLRQALDAFTQVGDQPGRALALYGLARVLQEEGRDEEALPVAREALRLRAEHGTPAAVATSESALGAIVSRLGMHAEAVEHCQRALRICEQGGLVIYQGEALYYLGLAHLRAGDHAAAASRYEQAAEIFREIGDMPDLAAALTLRAYAEEAAGDTAAARLGRAEAEAILDGMPPADAKQVRAWIEREAVPPPSAPPRPRVAG